MQVKNWLLATGLALLVFVMVVFTTSFQPTHPVTGLYVFGDSLSDVGTVFRATGGMYPPNPPYFQGRYSNGRVWSEYLADRLDLSTSQIKNVACGGATTGSITSGGNPYAGLVPDLLTQVRSLTQAQPQTDPQALYILWAGANDYLQGINSAEAPVANVTKAMNLLVEAGATRFLVANLPDLGQLPVTRTSTNSRTLSTLTQTHNQGLRRSLKILAQQHSDLKIAILDANTLYREAISSPATFGFTNVAQACLSGTRACSKPEQFLFWDDIHPTTTAHRHLGDAAFTAIQEVGIIAGHSVLLP